MTVKAWTDSTAANPVDVDVSTGTAVAADDYLIAARVDDTFDAVVSARPAGFTNVCTQYNTADSQSLIVERKKASGSETALSWTSTGTAPLAAILGVLGITGIDTTNPLDVPAVVANNNTAAASPWTLAASITPITDGCTIVAILASDVQSAGEVVPSFATTSGTTGSWNVDVDISGNSGSGNKIHLGMGTAVQTTAGAITVTATGTVGGISAGRSVVLFALRPSGSGTVSLDYTVSDGADDAQQSGSTVTVTGTTIGASLDATTEYVGIRFQAVAVPAGATIKSAYLSVVPSGTGEDEPLVTIFGEDADDAAAYTTGANDITNRTQTTANVAWSSANLGASGSDYWNTPELKTIVQEIVDRGGWASGNDMAFIIQGGATSTRDLTIEAFENAGANPPKLHIDYVPAAGGGSSIVPVLMAHFRQRRA